MNIILQSENFAASEPLRVFIHQKLSKLAHYFDQIQDITVHLRVEKSDSRTNKFMEVSLNVPGTTLVASEKAGTFEAATDMCLDKLRAQVVKYKEKALERA